MFPSETKLFGFLITVDGQVPAAVNMWFMPVFIWFPPSQLVQNRFRPSTVISNHQRVFSLFEGLGSNGEARVRLPMGQQTNNKKTPLRPSRQASNSEFQYLDGRGGIAEWLALPRL